MLKKRIILLSCMLLCIFTAYSQTVLSGSVKDESTNEPLLGANILVQGTVLGTITNVNGEFSLNVSSNPPLTLIVTVVGYERKEIEVTSSNTRVDVTLKESVLLGQEVIVSASRVAESVMQSPVSIERMNILDIQNTASTDFYSALKSMNGVDFSTQSLTFKSVNARGFGSNGNVRFVQLIDGIDNQAPGLNFPVGNVVGINELDLESVEMIPGAASALYGPNAIQGIILMNSKSPFEYQGLDIYTKLGVNHIDGEDDDLAFYKDLGLRYAKAFNNKFAVKITASWLNAQDFRSVDYRDQGSDIVERSKDYSLSDNYSTEFRTTNRMYDGVSIFGDSPIPLGAIADAGIAAGGATGAGLAAIRTLIPDGVNGYFTPRGYAERDFVDNTVESLKVGAALHYRITDKLELIGQYNAGFGSSVYTANDRFILDNFSIWTGKLELRGSNFYVRGYTTQENAGDTYAANTLAQRVLQDTYFPAYLGAYTDFLTGGNSTGANPTNTVIASNDYTALHQAARKVADAAYEKVGTENFNTLVKKYRKSSISEGGAKFVDKSAMYHAEGSYNFSNLINFADIVVGANYRRFALKSEGTIFALDKDGDEMAYNEFGGYIQIKKDFFDKLIVTASGRFDKSQFFKGQFTPRVAAVYEFLKGQNIRASYQTGFRIPTTQDQFIDLDVVTRRLLGRNDILRDRYNIDKNPVYTAESVAAAQAANDISQLKLATVVYEDYDPERVNTWEVGYKGLLFQGKLLIDAFYFQSVYKNFLAEQEVVQAVKSGGTLDAIRTIPAGYDDGVVNGESGHSDVEKQVFVAGGSTDISLQRYGYNLNVDEDVNTRGFGLGLEYFFGNGFSLGGNVSNNKMLSQAKLADKYIVPFNTPEWRYNLKISNRKLFEKFGFNFAYRWQQAYLWQSSIGTGVIPAYGTLDAQISYDIPSIKTRIKLGGSNILNKRYVTSFANPRMGAIYYVQLNFDNLLN